MKTTAQIDREIEDQILAIFARGAEKYNALQRHGKLKGVGLTKEVLPPRRPSDPWDLGPCEDVRLARDVAVRIIALVMLGVLGGAGLAQLILDRLA